MPATTPSATTTRNAYDWLADGFGPGVNGPLTVVVDTPTEAARGRVPAIVQQVTDTPGIAFVDPATESPDHGISTFTAFPTTAPQSAATEHLVHDLRRDLPDNVHIGGQTAVGVDFSTVLASRLPWFIGGVLLLSFVLLLIVFRSVLVPLKAVVMNLLSIGAAYGVMVMIFQWGWFGSVFGVDRGAPIEPWAPMMLFAIVFGLSMDYEVFLLSSIREEYDRTGDNRVAVVRRPVVDSPGHHGCGCDHGLRVRQLRRGRRPGDQADRPRIGGRGAHRCDARAARAGARHDGAARRPQLVAAEVAQPGAAPPEHRTSPHRCARAQAGSR